MKVESPRLPEIGDEVFEEVLETVHGETVTTDDVLEIVEYLELHENLPEEVKQNA